MTLGTEIGKYQAAASAQADTQIYCSKADGHAAIKGTRVHLSENLTTPADTQIDTKTAGLCANGLDTMYHHKAVMVDENPNRRKYGNKMGMSQSATKARTGQIESRRTRKKPNVARERQGSVPIAGQ